MPTFDTIPADILLDVLACADPVDLCRLASTSKAMDGLLADDQLGGLLYARAVGPPCAKDVACLSRMCAIVSPNYLLELDVMHEPMAGAPGSDRNAHESEAYRGAEDQAYGGNQTYAGGDRTYAGGGDQTYGQDETYGGGGGGGDQTYGQDKTYGQGERCGIETYEVDAATSHVPAHHAGSDGPHDVYGAGPWAVTTQVLARTRPSAEALARLVDRHFASHEAGSKGEVNSKRSQQRRRRSDRLWWLPCLHLPESLVRAIGMLRAYVLVETYKMRVMRHTRAFGSARVYNSVALQGVSRATTACTTALGFWKDGRLSGPGLVTRVTWRDSSGGHDQTQAAATHATNDAKGRLSIECAWTTKWSDDGSRRQAERFKPAPGHAHVMRTHANVVSCLLRQSPSGADDSCSRRDACDVAVYSPTGHRTTVAYTSGCHCCAGNAERHRIIADAQPMPRRRDGWQGMGQSLCHDGPIVWSVSNRMCYILRPSVVAAGSVGPARSPPIADAIDDVVITASLVVHSEDVGAGPLEDLSGARRHRSRRQREPEPNANTATAAGTSETVPYGSLGSLALASASVRLLAMPILYYVGESDSWNQPLGHGIVYDGQCREICAGNWDSGHLQGSVRVSHGKLSEPIFDGSFFCDRPFGNGTITTVGGICIRFTQWSRQGMPMGVGTVRFPCGLTLHCRWPVDGSCAAPQVFSISWTALGARRLSSFFDTAHLGAAMRTDCHLHRSQSSLALSNADTFEKEEEEEEDDDDNERCQRHDPSDGLLHVPACDVGCPPHRQPAIAPPYVDDVNDDTTNLCKRVSSKGVETLPFAEWMQNPSLPPSPPPGDSGAVPPSFLLVPPPVLSVPPPVLSVPPAQASFLAGCNARNANLFCVRPLLPLDETTYAMIQAYWRTALSPVDLLANVGRSGLPMGSLSDWITRLTCCPALRFEARLGPGMRPIIVDAASRYCAL